MNDRPKVVIAGATGFVGSHLARRLRDRFHVVGLSRSAPKGHTAAVADEWRSADLFSLKDAEAALAGVQIAYYLVHSMMPSARLTQGAFENLDLIAADNFARAAAKAGVKQIIYLGGLIPEGEELSLHLRSRLEVEQTLGARGVPLTALRAGIVIGKQGSSFQVLYRLVSRLPLMFCPKWTLTKTHPIYLGDMVELLSYCAGRTTTYGQQYDVGGPDVLTYRGLIAMLARLMGVKRVLLHVPLFSPGLSRLWVTLITGAPRALVAPLVQSLRHEMVAKDTRLQIEAGIPGVGMEEALRLALRETETTASKKPAAFSRGAPPKRRSEVRSVQRLPKPVSMTAKEVGEAYLAWLPHRFFPLRVKVAGPRAEFYLRFLPFPLLVLNYSQERSCDERSLFYIVGGILAYPEGRGRLEFRTSWNGEFLLAAIHEYLPRLPWRVYTLTQAKVHLYVMWRFGRYLASIPARSLRHR